MVMATITATAQKVGEQMYIYSNGQPLVGFLPAEIDSITYSCYDEDGIRYDDAVMQVIHTPDSIYRIPINDVDSVSFVRPSTIYKSGVIVLEGEIRQYIIDSDGFNLTLSANTPSRLVPKVGDRLATMEPDDQFPHYFAGEVRSVTTANGSIEVTCETLEFEDVVEQYANIVYAASEGDGGEQSPAKASTSNKAGIPWTTMYLPPINDSREFDVKFEEIPGLRDVEPDISFGMGYDYSIVPTARVRLTWFIRGGLYINAMMIIDNTISWSHHVCGTFGINKEESLLPVGIETPIPSTPFVFYADFGWFANMSGSLVWQGSTSRTTRTTCSFVYDRNNPENNTASRFNKILSTQESEDRKLYGDVTAEAGIWGELGLGFVRKAVVKVGARVELGLSASAKNLRLWNGIREASESSQFYDNIKDMEAGISLFGRIMGVWGIVEGLPIGISGNFLKREREIGTPLKFRLVPSFSDLKANRINKKSTTVATSAAVGQTILLPVNIGFTAVDKDEKRISTDWVPQTYSLLNMPPNASLDLKNIPLLGKYRVKPMVMLLGHEVMASPEVEVSTDIPVKITEFEQTGSHYQMDGYSHDGRTYDYKYDVAVTVELSDAEGVEDWGYVYKDPYGNLAHISLKNYGSPYTDTRYVYYRNDSKSTVTLYEYVKYEGEEDYVYGEPKDYDVQHSINNYQVVTLEASDIKDVSAQLNGRIIILNPELDTSECGFLYNTTGNLSSTTGIKVSAIRQSDGSLERELNNLSKNETYFFCAYIYADGKYKYGETKSFKTKDKDTEESYLTCPDDHHPHWIDLGLPSGTLWRCCNEGASKPEDFGGYYHFGAVSSAPSLDQIKELLNNCSNSWTRMNGVNGRIFTGPSGGTIFLPAAGDVWDGVFYYVGSSGYYWSSTPIDEDSAYDLYFDFYGADWHSSRWYYDLSYERPVRPVR